jgi:hypothetical protein
MPILLIRSKATSEQISSMLEMLGSYIKLAVDVERGILAGGGALHADCEAVLLDDGARQESVWGADWVPSSRAIHYEALINLRPRQKNLSMRIEDPVLCFRVEQIVRALLEVE